jgi:D-alanine-D-alanine ligase-like ATP-grasp enzyme
MGFDIIVDDKLKPWLLEVNSSPAMAMDGVADKKVKPDLLKETF